MKPEHLKSYFGSEKYKMVEFLGGMKEKSQAEENIDEEDKAQHALRNQVQNINVNVDANYVELAKD